MTFSAEILVSCRSEPTINLWPRETWELSNRAKKGLSTIKKGPRCLGLVNDARWYGVPPLEGVQYGSIFALIDKKYGANDVIGQTSSRPDR